MDLVSNIKAQAAQVFADSGWIRCQEQEIQTKELPAILEQTCMTLQDADGYELVVPNLKERTVTKLVLTDALTPDLNNLLKEYLQEGTIRLYTDHNTNNHLVPVPAYTLGMVDGSMVSHVKLKSGQKARISADLTIQEGASLEKDDQ